MIDAGRDQERDILQLVRTQRWFAQKHLTSPEASILDSLEFQLSGGKSCSWLLLSVEPGQRVYSIVVASDAGAGLSLVSPAHLLEHITRHKSVTTSQGGLISFAGSSATYNASTAKPLEECNSSNSLFSGDLGESACVAKFYRKMDTGGMRELSTLSALQSTGLIPRLFGAIRYRAAGSPQDAEPEVLCLFLEPITGRPAYEPFQFASRKGIAALRAGASVESVLADDAVTLPEESANLGRLIADFHSAATAHQSPRSALHLDACIGDLRRRWNDLTHLSKNCENASCLINMAPMAQLEELIARSGHTQSSIASSYSHGDLHLSHILFEGGRGKGRIIDPAHGICDTRVADHSARDLLQICRGFECFIFDEIATDIAAVTGQSRDAAAAFLADPENTEADVWMSFARRWSKMVFEAVLDGYLSVIPDARLHPITDPAWRGVFYLERLFHELEYNIAYDRAFFMSADITWMRNFGLKLSLFPPRPSTNTSLASKTERETITGDVHVLH